MVTEALVMYPVSAVALVTWKVKYLPLGICRDIVLLILILRALEKAATAISTNDGD